MSNLLHVYAFCSWSTLVLRIYM